jgi:N-acylglucosamine 2-epimerase
MEKIDLNIFKEYARLYKDALLKDVIPFWEKYSMDYQNGGYYSCLDRNGNVYDRDKFIWIQGREAWTFSMLYNKVQPQTRWLEMSKLGVDFLIKNGSDENGNFYFSVEDQGTPLIVPYNIFSDCFASMAFSQYAKASGDQETLQIAKNTYQNIVRRKNNPKGVYNKSAGSRRLKDFALPMILSNMVIELEHVLDPQEVERTLEQSVQEVMEVFLDADSGLIYEYVTPEGKHLDCFEGRLINPGHGIEAMWFMFDIAERKNDQQLILRATQTILNILEYGWDKTYGGLFYFMDIEGKPPQQLEWDQKLWWVHIEALVALAKAYKHTGNPTVWQWYEKIHEYSWSHFPDPEFGEWFGYLNRRGEPLLTLKGGKWKGCFHLPRALYQCWQTFEQLSEGKSGT